MLKIWLSLQVSSILYRNVTWTGMIWTSEVDQKILRQGYSKFLPQQNKKPDVMAFEFTDFSVQLAVVREIWGSRAGDWLTLSVFLSERS